MKLLRCAFAAACLLALAVGACAQEAITLKHALAAGDVSYYKKSTATEQTSGMGAGTKGKATAYYRQTVTKVEDGKLHLKLDYKGAESEVPPMLGTNPYEALKDKSFEIVIGPDGKEIKAIDFSGKIPRGVAYISVCSLADCILKEIHFQENAVSPGDSWEYDPRQDKPNFGEGLDIEITGGKVTYKFDEMEEVAGRECAMISYEYESTGTFSMPQTELQPGLPFLVDVSGDSADKGRGTIAFDSAEGRLVKYTYEGDSDMTLKFENIPDELEGMLPESMPFGEKMTVTVELTEKEAFDAALAEKTEEEGEPPPPPPEQQ